MPATQATGGKALTAALEELFKNPSNSKEIRTYELRFVNHDGANPSDIERCVLLDASAGSAQLHILPVKTTIGPGIDGAKSTQIILDPGDSVQAQATHPNRIFAVYQQIFAEPAP